MEKQYWRHWSFNSDLKGTQCWQFDSLGRKVDAVFLREMAEDFHFDTGKNRNSSDLVYRNFADKEGSNRQNEGAAHNAIKFYLSLQNDSGHFPGDYGGPHFLTPGLVIASYVAGSPLPEPHQILIKQYILNHQNADGGWGLHIEGSSTMFGTAMNYVALRLLGLSAEDEPAKIGRNWIKTNGGATGIPSWGKFYLSLLGVYEWDGCNSLFPEMWLMPETLPFHPSKYWCHARMVYLPMAYCYGLKVTGEITPLIHELRRELYNGNYQDISWKDARNSCASTDLYHQPSSLLSALNFFTNTYEKFHIPALRKKATNFILDYIQAEDEQTNYIDIGPVNQVINSVCVYHAFGKNSEAFKKHYERWFDYLWLAEDGMKMNGYNGSQLWDTAFAAQAIFETAQNDAEIENDAFVRNGLTKAYQYINASQIREEVIHQEKFYRHPSVGGWPFSNVPHGWPITDCTAEGLKTILQLNRMEGLPSGKVTHDRLQQACDLILSLQNKDGGWASYELTRAPRWVEKLNPSEIFGNIMIDYSYTECTSACVQSLIEYSKQYPEYRSADVEKAIQSGVNFILNQQRADGSWYGSWAVCFTYGTWFAVEALRSFSDYSQTTTFKDSIDTALKKAKHFLLGKQNADGGWGESFESCRKKEYVPHQDSQIINTAWALLSLMKIELNENERAKVERGIELIKSRQMPSGDFPQEGISGVFNHSCGITYTAYRNVFPIWALGRYKGWCKKEKSLSPSAYSVQHA